MTPEISTKPANGQKALEGFHTYLFNLIVFSPDKARAPYYHGLIQNIVEHFSSRVLFIEFDNTLEQPTTEFKASTVKKGQYSIGFEEIYLRLPESQRDKVSVLALPYLLPDLPVVLLWGQDPTTEHEVLPHLIKFSHRLIFDSECAENLQRFSHRVLAQADASHIDIVDLNWARIKGWRDAFDEVFDSPARLEQLTLAKMITITYNSRQDEFFRRAAIPALYLQGWLSSQLGWRLHRLEPGEPITRVIYFNGVGDTEVELSHQESAERFPGAVLSVDIEGAYDNHFCLKQKPGTQQAIVHISSTQTCELPFSVMISGPRLRYQFLKDLFYGRSSEHYLNALRMLSHQDWHR